MGNVVPVEYAWRILMKNNGASEGVVIYEVVMAGSKIIANSLIPKLSSRVSVSLVGG